MRKREKEQIRKEVEKLTNEQLEAKYYKAVYDCLGSQTDRMYELGYDMRDIIERDKYETYLCEYADVLEAICQERGIELWKEEEAKE